MAHILLAANSRWYIHNFRSNLIKALIGRGYQVSVLSADDPSLPDKTHIQGVNYYAYKGERRGRNPMREFLTVVQTSRIVRQLQPDIVLSFTPKINLYMGLACSFLKSKLIINVSGFGSALGPKTSNPIIKFIIKSTLRLANFVFFQNPEDAELSVRMLSPKILHDILPGSGVDLNCFNFHERFPHGDPFCFIYIGRLLKDKGVIDFLNAFKMIKKRDRAVEAIVLGAKELGHDAVNPAEFSALVEETSVTYLGHIDDVKPYLQSCHCMVLPSVYGEGVPRSLIEGAATGLPLIGYDNVGVREIISHRINGFLCKPDDIEELAAKMYQISTLNAAEYKILSESSHAIAVDRFDEEIVIRKYLGIVQSLQ